MRCPLLPCRLLDTLPLARVSLPGCANYKQGTLRQHFGVGLAPGQVEHDAGTDVTVLAQLLPHLVQVGEWVGQPWGSVVGGSAYSAQGVVLRCLLPGRDAVATTCTESSTDWALKSAS